MRIVASRAVPMGADLEATMTLSTRECLGWMEVNKRELDQLCAGCRVHLNPTFVMHTGWTPGWVTLTLVVSNIFRRPDASTTLQISGWGDRGFLTVDADGKYLKDTGFGPEITSGEARRVSILRVPLFRESGQLFCPFCAQPTVYRGAAEYCNTHGGMPDTRSSLVIPVDTGWQSEWVLAGGSLISVRTKSQDDAARRAADLAMKSKSPIEGDVCLSCKVGTYKWQAGTLKCTNNACWHRPLMKKP